MPNDREQQRQQQVIDAMRRALTGSYTEPVPGMEQLGSLPVPRPAPLAPGLAPPPVTSNDLRAMIGKHGPLPTPEQAQRNVEAIQSYGELIPHGIAEIGAGVYDLPKRPLHGGGQIARGLMKAGTPALGAALVVPGSVAAGVAIGTAAAEGSRRGLEKLGASPETAQDVGDILGLASGLLAGTAGLVRRVGKVRAAAEMNRTAETLMGRLADATPQQAAAMRARAEALVKAAQDLDPGVPMTAPPPQRPREPAAPPRGTAEPQVARAQMAQAEAQRATVPPPEPPPAPQPTPAASAAEGVRAAQLAEARQPSPSATAVERTRLGQLAEQERLRSQQMGEMEKIHQAAQAGLEAATPAPLAPEPSQWLAMAESATRVARAARPKQARDERAAAEKGFLASEAGEMRLPTPEQLSTARQQFKTRWFDEYTPVKELAEIAPLTLEESPYIAARMYAGHYGRVWDAHRQLREIAMPVNQEKLLPQWERLLELNRDVELYGGYNRPALEGYKSPRAASLEEARAQLNELRASMTPEQQAFLDAKAKDFYDFHGRLRKELHDSGIIGDEAFEAMVRDNEYYAPFHHVTRIDPFDNVPAGRKSLNVRNQHVVYAIKGSESETAPVLESTLRNVHRIISLAERNRASRTLAALSERPQWEDVIYPLARGEKPGPGMGKFSVFEDGVRQEYAAPAAVADAWQGVKPRELTFLQKVADFTNQGFRSGATMYYLPFVVKNIYRDYRTALLRSEVGFTPADWLYGFAQTVRRGPEFARYMRSGAAQSGFFERDIKLSKAVSHITESESKRVARHVLNPLAFLKLVSETIELTPRVGVFERALRAGMSETQAAWMARNVTQDFSSIGTWMRRWNMMTPFVNARLHGMANVYAGIRDNPMRGAAVVTFGTLLPAMFLHYHNRVNFPDVMAELDPDEGDRYYRFIHGREKDEKGNFTQVLKIPKLDIDEYFGQPLESFLDFLYDNHPRSWWEVMAEFASDNFPVSFMRNGEFAPDRAMGEAMPPVLGAAVDLFRGKDAYTGYSIEPGSAGGGSAANRWGTTPSSLELERSVGGRAMLGLSKIAPALGPHQYRHLVRRLLAGSGRLLTSAPEEETFESEAATVLGLDAVKRMFVGARGGATEKRENRELDPFAQVTRDEEIARDRNITRVLDDARRNPEEDSIDLVVDRWENREKWGDKALDDRGLERALLYAVSERFGMTPGQMAIFRRPDRAKALYIDAKQRQLSPEEYDAMEERWLESGYFTNGVFTELARIWAERDEAEAPAVAGQPQQPRVAPPRAGTVADRHNNPLNLRGPDGEFVAFDSPETGWAAGIADLRLKMEGRSRHLKGDAPLSRLFEVWAPAQEMGNHPEGYTEYVATRLGVSPDTPIRNLADRIAELAAAMGEFEGWSGGPPPGAALTLGKESDLPGGVTPDFVEAFRRAMGDGR